MSSVTVFNNEVEQSLRTLKKSIQQEGIFSILKLRRYNRSQAEVGRIKMVARIKKYMRIHNQKKLSNLIGTANQESYDVSSSNTIDMNYLAILDTNINSSN